MFNSMRKRIALGRKAASYEDALAVVQAIESVGGQVLGVTVFGQTFQVQNPKHGRKAGQPKFVERVGTVFGVFAVVYGPKMKAKADEAIAAFLVAPQVAAQAAMDVTKK